MYKSKLSKDREKKLTKIDKLEKEKLAEQKQQIKATEMQEAEARQKRYLQEKQEENTAVKEGNRFLEDFARFKQFQLEKMNEYERKMYHADLEVQRNLVLKYQREAILSEVEHQKCKKHLQEINLKIMQKRALQRRNVQLVVDEVRKKLDIHE